MYQHRPTFLSDQQESSYYVHYFVHGYMVGYCWAGFVAVHSEHRDNKPSSHREGFGHEGTARVWAGSSDYEQGPVCPKLSCIPSWKSGAVHFANCFTCRAVFFTCDSAVMSPEKEEWRSTIETGQENGKRSK